MSQSSENEVWNELHVQLVRDLEKKGVLWRYGVKHLKLWTDLMLTGQVAGVGEEPEWEQHLDKIITPPLARQHHLRCAAQTVDNPLALWRCFSCKINKEWRQRAAELNFSRPH